jgi:hypothetical protein
MLEINPSLKTVLKRLKLSGLLPTLPDRLPAGVPRCMCDDRAHGLRLEEKRPFSLRHWTRLSYSHSMNAD